MGSSNKLITYSRFIKVEHTLFSLPLIFAGAVLATGGRWPNIRLSVLILGAGFGGRTVAFALNRMIDRHIDSRNPRTAVRELPKGSMSIAEAWGVLIFGLLVYLACAAAIAPICLYASPIPVLVFIVYPYLKRFTALAHFGVGLADALAPLGGWVAVTQGIRPIAGGLGLAAFTLFWVTGFDIIYSTMDEDFDREEGLHSLPSRLGADRALQVSRILHILAFICLGILYLLSRHTLSAGILLALIGSLLFWESRKTTDIDLAFFKINAILGFVVLAFVICL
jgi:4-hydroxybenzoate polyprenyltransferase